MKNLVFLVLISLACPVFATNYFVATSGSDGNSGLSGSPWQTVSRVNTGPLAPADVVTFTASQNFIGTLIPTNGVTYNSSGSGFATITNQFLPALAATNVSGAVLINLKFSTITPSSGVFGAPYCVGFNINSTVGTAYNGWHLTNCIIVGGTNAFQSFTPTTLDGYTGWSMNGCSISNASEFGFFIGNTNLSTATYNFTNGYLGNCEIASITGDSTLNTASGVGFVFANCINSLCESNYIHDCGSLATQLAGPGAGFPIASYGITIQDCIAARIRTQGGDGGGFDIDDRNSNCVVQNCLAYNCDGWGYLFIGTGTGNVMRFNVGINNCQRTPTAGEIQTGGTSCLFCNNTIVSSNLLIHSVDQSVFYNNIFVQLTNAQQFLSFNTFNGLGYGNVLWRSDGSFSAHFNGVDYSSWPSFLTGADVGQYVYNLDPWLQNPSAVSNITSAAQFSQIKQYLPHVGQIADQRSLLVTGGSTNDFTGKLLRNFWNLGAFDSSWGNYYYIGFLPYTNYPTCAEYLFNNNFLDSSLNGNNATGVNSPSFVTGQSGAANSAVSFNGSNQYTTTPNSLTLNPTTALTIEFWVKNSLSGMPFNKGNFNEFYGFFSGGLIALDLYTSSGTLETYSTSTFPNDGNWYFYAATWDANNDGKIRVYKNGILDSTSATALGGTITANSSALTIGSGVDAGGFYFTGQIDDYKMSNVQKTPQKIYTDYLKGAK